MLREFGRVADLESSGWYQQIHAKPGSPFLTDSRPALPHQHPVPLVVVETAVNDELQGLIVEAVDQLDDPSVDVFDRDPAPVAEADRGSWLEGCSDEDDRKFLEWRVGGHFGARFEFRQDVVRVVELQILVVELGWAGDEIKERVESDVLGATDSPS